jgi:radical SAM protein with 4Fe4S-binding SPASM domain
MNKTFVEKNSDRKKLADIIPLEKPLGLCIEPTNICNFKCTQCPVSLPEFSTTVGFRGNMEMQLFNKIIQDIKKMGKIKNINLYGDGEPLINPNIAKMVEIINDNNISDYVTITTNASLLTEKIARELILSGLTYLRVSIYSIYDDRLKSMTKSNIKADDIFQNVSLLKKIRDSLNKTKPHIYVKMIDTYGPENNDFIKLYSKIADEVNIETPMNWNGFRNINLISNIDPMHKTDQTLVQGFYDQKGSSGIKKICTTSFHSLNVKCNGDVTICIVDWNKGTKVGNICKESLNEIWYGKKLREFRRMHIEGERNKIPSCSNCKYLYCNPDNIDHLSSEDYERILTYKGD